MLFVSCLQLTTSICCFAVTTCFHYMTKPGESFKRLVVSLEVDYVPSIRFYRRRRDYGKPAFVALILNVDVTSAAPIRVGNPQQHEVANDEDKPFSTRQTWSGSTFSYIYTTCTVLCAGTRLWRHSRWNCLTTSTSYLLTRPVRSSWLSGLAPTSTDCYVAIRSSFFLSLLPFLCCLLTDIRVG